eukprot:CAMPEP_0196575786 /NCGR_PEP_ID=MMETSP1081-20130531/5196_1 /TAXON_ID=36882 /ORGANISM="Pyramimonas amylifera, Strain CCMP720" /LENGTH=133 /DNA_ID=CAMNT_0041894193 /DNA_START=116 /DNA_END=517 /DNA_ORIENTATION=-
MSCDWDQEDEVTNRLYATLRQIQIEEAPDSLPDKTITPEVPLSWRAEHQNNVEEKATSSKQSPTKKKSKAQVIIGKITPLFMAMTSPKVSKRLELDHLSSYEARESVTHHPLPISRPSPESFEIPKFKHEELL